MASSKPPNQPKDTPAQPPQRPAPQGAAPDKDHPVFPDYASI